MRANRATDTSVEVALRRALHARGLRYRKNQRIGERLPARTDIVFTRARVAVFVDGCFWHGCPTHGELPIANREFWRVKLDRTRQRDHDVTEALRREGWHVMRIWEHDVLADAVKRVEDVVRGRATVATGISGE